MKEEVKKVIRLNEFDRHVLMAYSDVSLETGTKITAEAAGIKAILKNTVIKV